MPAVVGVMTNPASLMTVVTWALMVAATQFVLQVSDKFGPGVLWDFWLGRYHHPIQEERIFMFLDLASSTSIAEELGHVRYFEFISEFVADITEPVVEHGGQIYQYVGDEVVVSWPMLTPRENARCVACFFSCQRHLDSLAEHYLTRFGATADFRAGIHGGLVTAGEIGIVRKEIVFSGDVLSTTARIQAECKKRKVPLLVSGHLLDRMDLGNRLQSDPLGEVRLRGRDQLVQLFEVTPA